MRSESAWVFEKGRDIHIFADMGAGSIYAQSEVDGELDLRNICDNPRDWGLYGHGEIRKYMTYALRGLLCRGGYELTRLQFRIPVVRDSEGIRRADYGNASALYGECIDADGRTLYFHLPAKCRWGDNDIVALRRLYIGEEDGYMYFFAEDAEVQYRNGMRFYDGETFIRGMSSDSEVLGPDWLRIFPVPFTSSMYYPGHFDAGISPSGGLSGGTANNLTGVECSSGGLKMLKYHMW